VRRTGLRKVLWRELWNGNRERWRNMLSLKPAENIILWSWTRHGHYRQRYEAAATSSPSAGWVRLRTPAPRQPGSGSRRPLNQLRTTPVSRC